APATYDGSGVEEGHDFQHDVMWEIGIAAPRLVVSSLSSCAAGGGAKPGPSGFVVLLFLRAHSTGLHACLLLSYSRGGYRGLIVLWCVQHVGEWRWDGRSGKDRCCVC
ncbi:unnamed protein product, partial [Ectocarpus sp. 13 AM-2016]